MSVLGNYALCELSTQLPLLKNDDFTDLIDYVVFLDQGGYVVKNDQ